MGFPVNDSNNYLDVLRNESDLGFIRASSFGARVAVTAGQTGPGLTLSVPIGKCLINPKLTFSADRPMNVNGQIYLGAFANAGTGLAYQEIPMVLPDTNGGVYNVDLGFTLYEGARFLLYSAYSKAGDSALCAATLSGVMATQDFDFSAKRNVLILGDSIGAAGAMGNDSLGRELMSYNHFGFRLKNALKSIGKNVRIINKSMSGSLMADSERLLLSLPHLVQKSDLIILYAGMNNANATASAPNLLAFNTSIINIIKQRNVYNPNASILIVAPNVTDTATRTPNIAAYRTEAQNAANDATYGGTSRKVYFYNAGTAFALAGTASTDTNFSSFERSAGARLHPSDLGHEKIFNGIYDVVETTDFFVNF